MIKRYTLMAASMLCAATLSLNARNKPFPQAISYLNCNKPNIAGYDANARIYFGIPGATGGGTTPPSDTTPAVRTTAVADEEEKILMHPAVNVYPNPFNDHISVAFTLKETGPTSIVLYGINGKQTGVLLNETLTAGHYQKAFAPGNIPTGVYVLKLIHNGKVITSKLIKR